MKQRLEKELSLTKEEKEKTKSKFLIIILSSILLRTLIGFHNHSGQNNTHANGAAYGGDYEAQRHWMELTNHLPMKSWYKYDLQYWGLDYPILTAYHSYICGYIGRLLVGEYCMELDTSRGIEDDVLKVYMRFSVLVFDFLIYFSCVVLFSRWIVDNDETGTKVFRNNQYLWLIVMCLFQPSIVLIDHGHFQYNTISLGLSCWSFYLLLKNNNNTSQNNYHPTTTILASILYCLSLNFKQIALYYAPTIFVYLLGKCYTSTRKVTKNVMHITYFSWTKFFQLGVTVVLTFGILWLPYFYSISQSTSPKIVEELKHVLNRIFPFYRGLYESKVSNIWCVLSMKPIQIQKRIDASMLPTLALALTLILLLPSCIILFLYSKHSSTKITKSNKKQEIQILLWALSSTSLSFFLGSFQVHEKSILYAVTPLSLLFHSQPVFVLCFFTTFSTWTLWPLLQIDNLRIAYFSCQMIFISLGFIYYYVYLPQQEMKEKRMYNDDCYYYNKMNKIIQNTTKYIMIPLSWICMISLHIIEIYINVPDHLPDLFAVLWSIVGCVFFCYTWLFCTWNVIFLYRKSEVWKEDVDVARKVE